MAEHILKDLRNDPDLKWLGKVRTDPSKSLKDKYYRFHCDYSHNTDDCIDLKQQIENLIQRGCLQRFVAWKSHNLQGGVIRGKRRWSSS